MTNVMNGVRILEVAEHTFVPAASALLAEWGAEVIKIEHVERGDAMRGLASSGTVDMGGGVHVLLEHSNRGKQSLGLDLTTDAGSEILYKLAATCDVFLTNKLPNVRTKLRLDVDDIRAHNPDIIYVRGHGQGNEGPDADKGSYDSLAYWARAGIAAGQMSPESEKPATPPAPAFGDSIGAMTIAGGIMGALYHREKTGEATTVDVSLMGVGMWSMGAAIALSLQLGMPWMAPPDGQLRNPLTNVYKTADGRFVSLTCLQAAKYWPEMCDLIGRSDLKADDRFADTAGLTENAGAAADELSAAFGARTLAEWRTVLEGFSGQWAVVQTTLELVDDPQSKANGYIADYETADGTAFQMVSPPVHYDGAPPPALRAPEFNEHGDDILGRLGLDMEQILNLKVQGVVA